MRYRMGYFIESFTPIIGGAEKRAQSLLSRLENFDVHVYTINFGSVTNQKLGNINIHRIVDADKSRYFSHDGRSLITAYKFAGKVRDIIKDNDFDLYVFDQYPYYHFLKSQNLVKSPKIVQVHEILKNHYSSFIKEKMLEHYESQMFKNADLNIVTNDINKERLKSAYRIPDSRIAVIQNGIDMLKYSAKPGKNIIFVGRNTKDKNIGLVIELAKILKDHMFTIVSDVNDVRLENVVIKPRLSDEELYREYERSSVFITMSRREGFSIAALEAMGFGVPALYLKTAFNVTMSAIIKDGETGYACSSVTDMADKIRFLHDHEEKWKKMSDNAYALAKDYTWDRIAKQYESLLLSGVNR